ncbi:MAG TPA: hypothetical protein PKG52_10290 [bacterium]|nr:hypothetical protein [bacterium]HPS31094.1 hypothetical protein [bacterium]
MSNKDKRAVPAEMFFSTLMFKDVERISKRFNLFMIIMVLCMFCITVVSLVFTFAVLMKPTPVIAFDKEGRRLAFSGDETIQNETSIVRINRFMTDFINNFEGVSPNIEENLTEAYNMLTPKFRQILLDRSVHKEKIEAWKNKNFETKFRLRKLKILKGSLSAGSILTVEGIGEMSFKNVIDYSNEGVQRKDFVYFSALLIVTPVSFEISKDGLLVDFYKGSTLGDFRSLRAYLLENKKEYLIDKENVEVFE